MFDIFEDVFPVNGSNRFRHFTKDNQLILEFEVPGVDLENISAEAEGEVFTVKAKQGERSYRFAVRLKGVSYDNVTHELKNGILTFTFPFKEQSNKRKLLG